MWDLLPNHIWNAYTYANGVNNILRIVWLKGTDSVQCNFTTYNIFQLKHEFQIVRLESFDCMYSRWKWAKFSLRVPENNFSLWRHLKISLSVWKTNFFLLEVLRISFDISKFYLDNMRVWMMFISKKLCMIFIIFFMIFL